MPPDELKPDSAGALDGSSPVVVAASAAPEPQAAPVVIAPVEPLAEVVGAEAKPLLASERPSLLETFVKDGASAAKTAEPEKVEPERPTAVEVKPEAKPPVAAEPDKPVAEAKVEPKPAEPPAFEPVAYQWELPPQLKGNDERIGAFNTLLNEAKLPSEIGQDLGGKLLGMHAQAMENYATQLADTMAREQHRVFNATRDGWNKEVLADPQIGGAGHETAMTAIARMRDMFMSDARPDTPEYAKDMVAFDEFLRVTGAGDHPLYLKMLHRVAAVFDEPQARDVPLGGRPPPTNGRAPKGNIYTHPSSQSMDK